MLYIKNLGLIFADFGCPSVYIIMFIRQKPNKSGTISTQIVDKSLGKYEVLKTIGSSDDPNRIDTLMKEAQDCIIKLRGQLSFHPERANEIANSIYKVTITTPITGTQESRLHIQNDEQVRLLVTPKS